MNQNQEFAGLLIKIIEVASSTSASAARVLANGMNVAIETAPDKPRVTNGQLLMSDIGVLSATIGALVRHMSEERRKKQ